MMLGTRRAPPVKGEGYELVGAEDRDEGDVQEIPAPPPAAPLGPPRGQFSARTIRLIISSVLVGIFFVIGLKLAVDHDVFARSRECPSCPCPTSDVPQYFDTTGGRWLGPTATGKAPFLAETRIFNPTAAFVPNDPLQTDIPVDGMTSQNPSIFKLMGYLSPYSPSPGFGVDEYPLPAGADIVQLQMLSRHGARYPTAEAKVAGLGKRIAEAKKEKGFKGSGLLGFLNDWQYEMGMETLIPRGRQELYSSGVLHNYMYGQLYNPNSKIIARTTTQHRMLESAENFLAGFFGLKWENNVTLEVIIEGDGFNNSLAGYDNCPNSIKDTAGYDAASQWAHIYLQNATERFRENIEGDYVWTVEDTYDAQSMCSYETVVYGSSLFCTLFTYEEWVHFGYSIDLVFAGSSAFQSTTGRAVGLGYQQEVIARLKNHTLGYSGSQINVTLDSNTETFPLNQNLYFDFSHDTNIVSIMTAFGFKQFAALLKPTEYPGEHNLTISHIVPFGARLDIEIIKAPKPVKADRTGYEDGGETKYVHFVLNQRTIPLGFSFDECGVDRLDGWCELGKFLKVQEKMPQLAKFEEACFGEFKPRSYGETMDGAPS